MTYITIDSNISEIAPLAAKYVTPKAKVWCRNVNKCNKPNDDDDDGDDTDANNTGTSNAAKKTHESVYYNTPISMADNILDHNNIMNENSVHFIYIDYNNLNSTLSRIMKNLKYVKKRIVISNVDANVPPMGLYQVKIGKCSKQSIAELIANIVILYLMRSKPVHPEDLKKILSASTECKCKNEKFDAKTITDILDSSNRNLSQQSTMSAMNINLYELLKSQSEQNNSEHDDCQVCKV